MTNLYFSLAIYAALAITLGVNLWLYLSVHRKIANLRKELKGRGDYCDSDRERILARHRAGDDIGRIASVLNLPRNEVELTLKLARN